MTQCEAIRQSWPQQKVSFQRLLSEILVLRYTCFIQHPGSKLSKAFQSLRKSGFSVLSAEICGWQLEVQRQIERRQRVAGRWGTQCQVTGSRIKSPKRSLLKKIHGKETWPRREGCVSFDIYFSILLIYCSYLMLYVQVAPIWIGM